MGRTVGSTVEIARGLSIRLLGTASVSRDGAELPMPRSRKVRALLAFLALGSAPVTRTRLCDLLWAVPNDPRGELRWCLSKLRGLLDDEGRRRVVTVGDGRIELDLSDCVVDAKTVDRAQAEGIAQLSKERLEALGASFAGDFLEGLEIDGNPEFTGWLTAQRQRYRATRVAILSQLTSLEPAGSDERFRHLQTWLEVAPFDPRAHEVMLASLLDRRRVADGEAHLAATIRSFEQEGLEWASLREAWHRLRNAASERPRVALALALGEAESPAPPPTAERAARRRASVAVMPFHDGSSAGERESRVADGLTEDIITRLAKLRVLFVIARGTAYALRDRAISEQEAGRILNVEYVVSGSLRREGARLAVVVEIVETESGRIVWTDRIDGIAEATFSVLDTIVDRIVASIADEIEAAECSRALLKPPSSLDAWEAYHRGLWHMYKFNGPDNHEAEQFFRQALRLDPTFSRAHAGLSFTHFQNAFLDLTPDHDRQIDLAFETAGRSVDADIRDPGAHWAMGRALWLRGEQDASISALGRSIELSPNFALGHYTLGFVHSQAGDPKLAIAATNHSRELSPFDPLQFAMLASRALAHVRLGEFDEAAQWATKATARPNAHIHILAIAAQSLVLAKRRDEALKFIAKIQARVPGYGVEDLLRAFRFDADTAALLRQAAKTIGFDSGR
jgi:DNA-binding SARP family transcriptional activator/TolB-like protein